MTENLTVGELKERLSIYPDDFEISFGGKDLEFYRLKQRGEKLVVLEFNQSVYRADDGSWHVTAPEV